MNILYLLCGCCLMIYIITHCKQAYEVIVSPFRLYFYKDNEETIEEYSNSNFMLMNEINDSVEVETPIIQHNNNKLLFPFDDLPNRLYEYSDEENEETDISLYSSDDSIYAREIGN